MNTFSHTLRRGIFGALIALACSSASASDWKLSETLEVSDYDATVHVYTRPIEGQVLKQFKGSTVLNASLLTTFAAISDLPNVSSWMYNNKQSKRVQGTDGGSYIYVQIKGPSVVADRDSVLENTVSQNNATITVNNVSASNDIYPEQSGYVRMNNVASKWILKPISDNKTEVTFIGHAEPGGWIPNWVANLVVSKMPSISLQNLHREVTKAKYRDITVDDVKQEVPNAGALQFN